MIYDIFCDYPRMETQVGRTANGSKWTSKVFVQATPNTTRNRQSTRGIESKQQQKSRRKRPMHLMYFNPSNINERRTEKKEESRSSPKNKEWKCEQRSN